MSEKLLGSNDFWSLEKALTNCSPSDTIKDGFPFLLSLRFST